jgi:hypothetical protein
VGWAGERTCAVDAGSSGLGENLGYRSSHALPPRTSRHTSPADPEDWMNETEMWKVTNLPPFTAEGLLPPGDYAVTLDEIRNSHLVNGPSPSPSWDRAWRSSLVDHLEILVSDLWQCGIDRIFVSGSFVELKDRPSDIDGYFECDKLQFLRGELERHLNLVNADRVWTWDLNQKSWSDEAASAQLPMWHLHRAELWPHYDRVGGGTDSYGHDMLFPSLFRRTKYPHRQKGIIRIVRRR